MASTRGSQSAVQELGPRGRVGADSGKYEVRSKNGANGMSDIEGDAAGIAASEPTRGDASETDGQTERSNGREHMSQCGQRVSFNYESCDLVEARVHGDGETPAQCGGVEEDRRASAILTTHLGMD